MNIHINDFDGPLDLLLHLVKESKMDIYDIKISQIIDQYLEIIKKMQDLNIDIASSYLIMSAELLHLKSKKLINQKIQDEEDEFEYSSVEDLKDHLLEYQLYKELSDEFKILEEKRKEVYTKLPENINEYTNNKVINNNGITIDDLMNAFLKMRKRENLNKLVETKITKNNLSINNRINYIRNIINKQNKVHFSQLFEIFSKDYVVVTFLSILAMSNNNEITLSQKDNFDDIIIERMVVLT